MACLGTMMAVQLLTDLTTKEPDVLDLDWVARTVAVDWLHLGLRVECVPVLNILGQED
jgi:hypothetical protein